MSDLVRTPDGWVEVPPARCPDGHQLGPHRVLVGWRPCFCGGHRTYRCGDDQHADEDSRMMYRPALEDKCKAVGARLMSPQGLVNDEKPHPRP